MKRLLTMNMILLCLIVSSNTYLYSKVSYFIEKEIKAEYQIFNIKDRVQLDSLEIEFFSNGEDSLIVGLYKDENFYFKKTSAKEIYLDTIVNLNNSLNRINIDLTQLNIEVNREELIFEFKSLKDNSRLIIDGLIDTVDCGSNIIGRYQKFIKNNSIINGRSNYRVKPYYQIVEDAFDFNYSVSKDRIDSTLMFNKNSNISSADFNNDEYLDLFIENKILLNDKYGNLTNFEKLRFGDEEFSINQIYDLNNDGNLELLRIKADGNISIYSINSDLEIINELNASYSGTYNEINKVLFLDIDKNDKSEIILVKEKKIEILHNKYPLFESEEVELNEKISDANIDYISNKIILNTVPNAIKSQFLELNSDFFSKDRINNSSNSISFINEDFLNEDRIEFRNEYSSLILNRRILDPKYVYVTNLECDLNEEIIIVSSNVCQTNTIFNFNNERFFDISEKSNLKFLDLRNSLILDLNRDGYKEIVQLLDNTINILELSSKIPNVNLRMTSNSNVNTLTVNEKETSRICSNKEFGLNQIYGQVQLNNSDFSKGDIIQLNSEKYQLTENKFVKLFEESQSEFEVKGIIVNLSPKTGDLEFISSTEIINSIKIINSVGQEIYSKSNINKRFFNININNINSNLPQTVYYYLISTNNNSKILKGQFVWVK